MSILSFEIGNAIAMLIAAVGLSFLPFIFGVVVAVLAIGFAMWSIPLYINNNAVERPQKGYIFVGVLFLFTAYLFGSQYALAFGYIGFNFIFRYCFVLYCVDDEGEKEKEFNKRLAKVIKSYEEELNTLRERVKGKLSSAEYDEKIQQFRLAIEAEYRVKMQAELSQHKRRLERLAESKDANSAKEIQRIERKFQQDEEKARCEQEARIAEYVQKLDKLQNELAISQQEIIRERARTKEKDLEILKKQHIIDTKNKELNQYRDFINKLQSSNTELQARLSQAKDENEKLKLEMEEVEKICKNLRNKMPETFNGFLAKTKEKWIFIKNPKIIDSISSAEMLYSMYEKEYDLGDYSPVVVQYVKSVEMLLVDVLRFRHMFHERDKNMMLKQLVDNYITNNKNCWDFNIGEKIHDIRPIRNRGSHKGIVTKKEMCDTRNLVIGEEDNSNNKIGIIPYMNTLLR